MKSKEHNVVISPRAVMMVAEHVRFLSKVNIAAAEKLRQEFINKVDSLKTMPERCPWITNYYLPKEKYRKLLFAGRYLIIFQIKEESVIIDYVLDCRKDNHNLL